MSANFGSGNKPTQTDTEYQLLVKILNVLNLSSGTGGGVIPGQIVSYSANPTSESVVPANQSAPAMAYSNTLGLPVYTWNTSTKTWQ